MIHLGGKSDVDQFKSIDDQVAVLRVRRKRIADEMREAAEILDELVLNETFIEFLTFVAYPRLN
jgi:hypothetical protein